MIKTALDLTPEELSKYRPIVRFDRNNAEIHRTSALKIARKIARLLKTYYQAQRVILFGSLAHNAWFTPHSDIDLAVLGIPVRDFYSAVTLATEIDSRYNVDVVDLGYCRPEMRDEILQTGLVL